MKTAQPVLTVPDRDSWREWLDQNEDVSDGVWLTLSKKGVESSTSLTYVEALEEALISGWIDGQRNAVDEKNYRQRFTPRRKNSLWSKRNVILIEALTEAGKMRERGQREVALAQEDGRWERAYPGSKDMQIPPDVQSALEAEPKALEVFEKLSKQSKHALLLDVLTASSDTARKARLEKKIQKLLESY